MLIRVCIVSIIALAASGCGSSGGDGKAGTQAAAEAPKGSPTESSMQSCSLLTEADIKEVTGLDIQSVSQDGAMCMYRAQELDGVQLELVPLSGEPETAPGDEVVTGLGDKAVFTEFAILWVAKGDRKMTLNVSKRDATGRSALSPDQARQFEVELARRALERMR